MIKSELSIDQIICMAELNKLSKIVVFGIRGVDSVEKLILAGPSGPIEVVVKK